MSAKTKRILLILLLVSLNLFGQQGLVRLYRMKQMARALRYENEDLARQNGALTQEIEKLQQDDYLERLIREERGYVAENERLLEIPKSP